MAIEIEGARRLRSTLRRAGYDLSDLKAVNKSAAATVAGFAVGSAPKRTGKLTGTIRAAGTARAGIVRAGFKRVPYAGPIHWGWPQRKIKAQPWLSNSAKATEHIWVSQYQAELYKAIASIKGK